MRLDRRVEDTRRQDVHTLVHRHVRHFDPSDRRRRGARSDQLHKGRDPAYSYGHSRRTVTPCLSVLRMRGGRCVHEPLQLRSTTAFGALRSLRRDGF